MDSYRTIVWIRDSIASLPSEVRSLPVGFQDEEGYTSFLTRFIVDPDNKNVMATDGGKYFSRTGDEFLVIIQKLIDKFPEALNFTMSCSVHPLRIDEGKVEDLYAPFVSPSISAEYISLAICWA